MTFHSLTASNVTESGAAVPTSGVRTAANVLEFLADPCRVRAASRISRFLGTSPVAPESTALYRDAIAELAVADIVDSFGEGWSIINGICLGTETPAPSRDAISHVIVGENGIFAVTTVNVKGEPVWVSSSAFVQDGVRMPHLRDAEYSALRLSQRLYELSGIRAEVVPAVVVATPRGLIISRPPRRVAVLTPNEISGWVRSHSGTVSREHLAAIISAARQLVPARGGTVSINDGFDRMRAVRRSVRLARRTRIAWVTAALVSAWVLVVLIALQREGWL